MKQKTIDVLAQAFLQWVALLGCGALIAYDHGWHTGVAVGLAVFAIMPVAR